VSSSEYGYAVSNDQTEWTANLGRIPLISLTVAYSETRVTNHYLMLRGSWYSIRRGVSP